jgi:signal peptidase II
MQDQLTENNAEPSRQVKSIFSDYLVLVLGAGSIIALDTWTKVLVDKNIPVGGAWLPDSLAHYLRYFRVTHIHNTGTAFSMFAGADQVNLIISILAIVVAIFIAAIFPRIDRNETALRAAVILQLGGTIGNLISRLTYGYVLDFISVGNFAVFNIADASLVIGASLMVLAILIEEIKERKSEDHKVKTEEKINSEEHS